MSIARLVRFLRCRVRLTNDASNNLSKRHYDELSQLVSRFNGRGGGSFKMCIQPTRDAVIQVLNAELARHFTSRFTVVGNLEFRVNFNEVDSRGLTWEGFGLMDGKWYTLTA